VHLSLVIPIKDDVAGIVQLLRQVESMNLFHEVIVIDDHSDQVLEPVLQDSFPSLSDKLTVIRFDANRGAGAARNAGIDIATGTHLIFFDSDDLFGEDFTTIVHNARNEVAQGDNFDMCIFRHHDSRNWSTQVRGGFAVDETYWKDVDATDDLKVLTSQRASTLCRIAAYPWNKIYSIDFLRRHKIRCTELAVHNDVELHWASFIAADTIIYTSLIGAEHFVTPDGDRLTNRRDAERLKVFEAFENVWLRLTNSRKIVQMIEPAMSFFSRLVLWIDANIAPEFKDELEARASRFFMHSLSVSHMSLLTVRDAELAGRINKIIVQGLK